MITVENDIYLEMKDEKLNIKLSESNEWDWAKETKLNPLESEYYIIDNRSHRPHLDERHENDWILMRIIDRYPNGDVKYKVIESNVDPESNWGLGVRCTESNVSGEWLKNLLGMDSNLLSEKKEPYWIPHDGDTSNLPKSEKYVNCEESNKPKNISEGDELDWIKNTEVDTIKVGAIFKDTEDERLVITNIDPESSSMTIKSLDFTGEGEDHTLKKNWEIEEWLDLIHSGDIRWVGSEEMNESDDFDWVREVPNNLPKDRPWVLVNDVDSESEEVSIAMQKFLFGKLGFKWISGRNEFYNEPFLAFQLHVGDGSRVAVGYHKNIGEYYSNPSPEAQQEEYERRLREFRKEFGDDVYFWSDIGSNQINESDDMDWIKTTPTVKIGGKNDYPIEDVSLGTKVITPEGNVFTIEDIVGGHQDFQHVWGRDLKPAWLGPKNDIDNRNWYNALFLRKVDDSINESNEFDWVGSALDKPIEFIPGDEIKVINVGREDAFIKYLGVYGRPYKFGAFGPNITGVVFEREGFNSRGNFFLEVKRMYNGEEKFDRILFPYPEELNRLRDRNKDYKDLDIQYEYLGNKSIKEVEQMYYKPLYGKTSNGDFQKEEDGTYKVWWIEPTDDDKPLLGENTKHSLCTYSNGEKILHPIKDDTHLKNILNGKQLVQQKHLKDIK